MEQKEARRKQLIQLIHIGKSKLQMDKEVYRLFLVNTVGKDSCMQMNLIELNKVVDAMKKRGFQVSGGYFKDGKRKSPPSYTHVSSNIVKKIRAKWLEMADAGIIRDRSEDGLNAFVKNIAKNEQGEPIPFVSWLNNAQASIVLERLKQWQKRTIKE
ncbi:gp16 family protein [Aggregatibacter actinomycetemcomitans]|uniref:gp16 family protein n=1 Tax=Aggregatibacter actinomycetemcomitans TaxID=714 RepID=UPI00022BFD92|nr:regulatory protein GemA [Aggregatibacter actinomycetemcomitans]KOE31347.1 regulatory protein [Aggregatibacter actinomycetemcomitans D17P-3]KOE62572.1 regulatory protein [Aggregatibacter actinomycetemcomitans serotype c str. D17P-2]